MVLLNTVRAVLLSKILVPWATIPLEIGNGWFKSNRPINTVSVESTIKIKNKWGYYNQDQNMSINMHLLQGTTS